MSGTLSGGEKLQAALSAINAKLTPNGPASSVSVGFLEGQYYPDGTSVPMVAAVNEFGATIHRDAGTVTIYRKLKADGSGFARGGRFVKRAKSDFASTHATPAYDITIPPRPYFRNMIAKNGPTWGAAMARNLKRTDYDALAAFGLMGQKIKAQLQTSINELTDPPNAPSTIRAKGFAKPLIGKTRIMWKSVDYRVNT